MRLGLVAAVAAVLVLALGVPPCCAIGVCPSCEAAACEAAACEAAACEAAACEAAACEHSEPDCCGAEKAPEPCDCSSHDEEAIAARDAHAPLIGLSAVAAAVVAAQDRPAERAPNVAERPHASPAEARTLPLLL